MVDQAPQFEHAALESDMRHLAEEVARHRESAEFRGASGEELLKQAIRSVAPAPISDANAPSPAQSPLPAYAQDASPETKLEIEYLIDLALHSGIAKANAAAKGSNPFVLDAFHDALAGKLYPEFKRRGIVQ